MISHKDVCAYLYMNIHTYVHHIHILYIQAHSTKAEVFEVIGPTVHTVSIYVRMYVSQLQNHAVLHIPQALYTSICLYVISIS